MWHGDQESQPEPDGGGRLPLRVTVVGGSIGGLSAAVWLRELGCEVDVFERSPVLLEDRGAGILLNPATVRYFVERRVLDIRRIAAPIRKLQYLGREGDLLATIPAAWWSSAYNVVYRSLLACVDRQRYHLGEEAVGVEQDEEQAWVSFASGRVERADLAIFADGVNSAGRRVLAPTCAPVYAGYIAWRGTVSEGYLKPATFALLDASMTYHLLDAGHMLAYPVPNRDGAVEPGRRLMNWLWYRNVEQPVLEDLLVGRDGRRFTASVPAGFVAERHIAQLHADARALLPAPFAELVTLTSEPFIEVIADVEVHRMVFGRACLIGDAAFRPRPHAAAGTAKAAEDAYRLATALAAHRGDVPAALRAWEPRQLPLGRAVVERARQAGDRLQHGRWQVGELVPFGLYQVSDSTMHEEDLVLSATS
jgi:2,6-dihydroxypyridine 3-monooxygenase